MLSSRLTLLSRPLRALCAPVSLGLNALILLGMVSAAQPAIAQTLLSDNFNSENGGSRTRRITITLPTSP